MARARIENGEYSEFDDAIVVNNHYDSDGVLSVFACINPVSALMVAPLMVAGAEAGDFGEWSSDAGVKLDCALSSLCTDDDDEGYEAALRALPDLLADLEGADGSAHEALWRPGFEAVLASWEAVEAGEAELSMGAGRIALLTQPAGAPRLQSAALHRGLRELGVSGHESASQACSRVLRAEFDASCGWRYAFEKPGHGWVQRLVERQPVPPADGAKIAATLSVESALDERLGLGTWVAGGSGGLVKICRSEGWVQAGPDAVMAALLEADEGARA